MADAGMKEPYAYYLKQLDNNEAAYTNPGDKTTVGKCMSGKSLGPSRRTIRRSRISRGTTPNTRIGFQI